MSIETTVGHFARLVGEWVLHDQFVGVPTGPDTVVHSIAIPVVKGHRYLVEVTASGLMNTTAAVTEAKYAICVGGNDWVCSQNARAVRGAYDGLLNFPVHLSAVWTAPSDQPSVTFDFRFLHTGYQDWILDTGHHRMFVLDLGPGA